jgi:hypothetical protein
MSRSADYTIKGFLYQFNKTLLEILNSQDDGIITVEGIVEDVEIVTPAEMTAIQCKYHEASETFTPSGIFEPLLQMMHHFHANTTAQIRYILFAHYPSVKGMHQPTVGMADLQAALDSENKGLQKYVLTLRGKVNLDGFLSTFAMEFGPTYDDLVAQVHAALKANGIPEGDIDTLAYPNAINMIAGLSVKHDPTQRKTTKRQFLESLKGIRKTAISRWTMALRTRKQLLDARRKQLKTHLDKNSRLRYLLVDSASLDDYAAEIVLFLSDYLDKYHFKHAHISTPVLCLCTSRDDFRDIQYRLYAKGIICTDGYIGEHFDEARFFRDPLSSKGAGGAIKREFALRLLRWEDHCVVLNNRKCDDMFIIGEPDCASLNTVDVNVEHLAAASIKEIKYVMGVSNVYE